MAAAIARCWCTPPLLLYLAVVAQGVAAQPLPPLDEYHVRTFGPAEGVRYGDVRGLAQLPDGNLHVANSRSLYRFDGSGFQDIPLAVARPYFIRELYRDRRDRLWLIANPNDPIGYYADGRFQALPPAPVRLGRYAATRDGDVWYGGFHGLVHAVPGADPYTLFTRADGLPSDSVSGVVETADGHTIAVTRKQLARIVPDASRRGGFRFVPFGPEWSFTAVAANGAPGLWLVVRDEGAKRRLVRYHEGQFTELLPSEVIPALPFDAFDWEREFSGTPGPATPRRVYLPGDTTARGEAVSRVVSLALRSSGGILWLVILDPTGRDELVRYDGVALDTVLLQHHLEFRKIRRLLEDHEGSLWVGTDRGLLQLVRRRVFTVTRKHGLAESFTVPVLQTRDGVLWVGTWGGGLHRYADGRLTSRSTTADGLPDDRIRSLYEAADGTLWVGTDSGFAALRDGVVVSSVASSQAYSFAETSWSPGADDERTLWVGTIFDLLYSTSDGFVPHRPGFWHNRRIWALHTARDGSLWIGSERGLFRLVGDSLHTFGPDDGLRSGFVVSMHEEGDGTLWFGTYSHGLHRYRDGRFVALTTAEGMLHDGTWRMVPDDRGGMWMSSDGGIFRVDHARLNEVADALERGERPRPLAPIVFTETEGTPSRESNRASPAGWRLDDGRIAFNNIAGLVVIDPDRALEPRPPPRTVLQSFTADGEQLALRDSTGVRLKAGMKQLTFDFAALSFIAPEQNRYRYRLDGYDTDWVNGGTERRARYTNLPPGRYSFRVQGAGPGTPWSGTEATVAFDLAPFVWHTWWFRLSALAALAVLITTAYRYRVGRLMEVQRLRMSIAADLHDDVGSNLSSIALLSEMLQADARPGGIEQKQLRRINAAADETIDALRDIIWLVGPGHGDLTELVRRMRGVAADLLNGTTWRFDAATVHARPLSMSFMRNTLLIYKEALHNVARHAHARDVTIQIGSDRGDLVLVIEDDGIGFDEGAIRPGHGLVNMRRRAEQLGGRIEITRPRQGGTRITFSARMAQSRDGHEARSTTG